MRFTRTLLALSLLVAAPSFAATGLDATDIAAAESLRERALRGSEAWNVVESLTTEVGPRLAGTPADALAVEWAEAKLKAMGFDRVYREPVTFPVWLRHHERAQVLAPYPQPLVVTALGGSVGTGDTPLEAEVVAFATLDALKAAPEGSLEGKIALITNRMVRFKDGRGYGPAVGARSN
ncbi:MAG TPA: peptidase M28 family protein, partial [Arenimonas sp.]|nr:peptidase M28 family protein [Arenimonas sp.]